MCRGGSAAEVRQWCLVQEAAARCCSNSVAVLLSFLKCWKRTPFATQFGFDNLCITSCNILV